MKHSKENFDDTEANQTTPIMAGHYAQPVCVKSESLKDHNLIISQSTPDLLDDLKTGTDKIRDPNYI